MSEKEHTLFNTNVFSSPGIKMVGQTQIQQLSKMMGISLLTQTSFRLDRWAQIAATNYSEDDAN